MVTGSACFGDFVLSHSFWLFCFGRFGGFAYNQLFLFSGFITNCNINCSNFLVGAQMFPEQFKDFKLSVQSKLQMNNLHENDREMKIQPLTHSNSKSSVHAYVIENFLSDVECNSLAMVHSRHVSELNKQVPIICFDSIRSFREYLKDAKLKIKVSLNDFTEGTTCINETFSAKLQPHFKWSFSTAFYPGESKFSTMFAEKIRKATGLKLENGGKFQITSYPPYVGKLKN